MEDNLKPTELNANKNILSTLKKGANLSVGLLNGIVGDFLDKDNNGLAVQMQFYANEKPFTISKENIETVHKKISSKVCGISQRQLSKIMERICKTILTTLLFIFVTIPVCIFRKTENNFLN